MSLHDHGWNAFVEAAWADLDHDGLEPARVLCSGSNLVKVITASGERLASVAGRLRLETGAPGAPVVGDWVAVAASAGSSCRIEAVLARRTVLERKEAGRRSDVQALAAHVDRIVIVMGLDGDFNLRRLERLLTLAQQSGARPIVVLNKCDLPADPEILARSTREVALEAPVLTVSCLRGDGVEDVRASIAPGLTAVLVGSSGAGKSTLTNRLLGDDQQATREVRAADGRGRHTTTRRELFLLPGGGLLIDSPGIREAQIQADESSLARAFEDVASLAGSCRYRDCSHQVEPGCAVREAAESGSLPAERLQSYRALLRELRYQEIRHDAAARREQKRRWRAVHRAIKRSRRR